MSSDQLKMTFLHLPYSTGNAQFTHGAQNNKSEGGKKKGLREFGKICWLNNAKGGKISVTKENDKNGRMEIHR